MNLTPDLRQVQCVALKNASLTVSILTLGASIQSLYLKGYKHSLVLGSMQLTDYLHTAKYFGAVVGRVANRINRGHAVVGGLPYSLPLTSPEVHHLHGGPNGVSHKIWSIVEQADDRVQLQITLPDGDMGYPGNMVVTVWYRLLDNTLEMEITATTETLTICNFAGHSYVNLDGKGSILDHQLSIQAAHYLPVDAGLIPTGEVMPTSGSAFDFTQPRIIGRQDYPGLDTNFCLSLINRPIQTVATLKAPITGLTLHYQTTQPGLQVYDGRHIQLGAESNINQGALCAYAGLALEAQHWPDAINHPHFPSILLTPEETYRQVTRYVFE
ncbi:aldose epimerase family protein [Marinomonas sp. IMCC 4694]|uniref:aldose epimerase family protein n=1 Tax=Marinomonas sp. IMCC 4694 TaxID=2605432 RepID=UPI0011E6B785|nr:aldose epimerase family protein [Marinomonas sp. IMCC 4694]TYL48997.1 galactose mutarotase [Marinomonas sp. IMCC 4694]